MNREILEKYLAILAEDIGDARRRLARQTEFVAELETAGRDASASREICAMLRRLAANLAKDRELIERLLQGAVPEE